MSVILLVCTGNLCRSPMAAGFLRHQLAGSRHQVRSAGLWAPDDQPASEHAVAVMAEHGIDISDHRAHTLNSADVAEAELILVMTQEHARIVRTTWPQYAWKVHRLSEVVGKRRDVQDPYGGPIEAYRVCAEILSGYVSQGVSWIERHV